MKLIIEIEMNEEVNEISNKDSLEIKTDGSLSSSSINSFSTEIKDVPDSIIRAACRRLSIGDSEDDGKRKRRKEDQLALIPKGAGKNSTVAKADLPDENQGGEDVNHTVAEHIGPKVPPLKIVIPQQVDTEQGGVSRGKQNVSARHSNLPYVVVSHASSYSGGYSALTSTRTSGSASITGSVVNSIAVTSTDFQRSQHRVLRSNQRSNGISSVGDNSSLSNVDSSPHRALVSPSKSCLTQSAGSLPDKSTIADSSYSSSSNGTTSVTFSPSGSAGEVPPRKRRLKTSREVIEQSDAPSLSLIEQAFLDGSMANCYQMFVNIRKQIEMKRRSLFPVQPKPPQGFKDYLMNKCTYLLDDDAKAQINSKVISLPPECPFYMSNLYGEQEMERLKLKMQHLVEKEKLVLSVEQEILRVHGRAARALANQALPFSVCSLLKDEDVYQLLPTTQQQEKERNARSRYNGRIFISWLQDVDDKWEKIKEEMLLRHRNEAIGLQARQKLVWSLQMCSYGSYNSQIIGQVNDTFVPMIDITKYYDGLYNVLD